MKIAYCIRETYTPGGMVRVLVNRANYLADVMGFEVSIITINQNRQNPYYDFSSKIRHYDLGINYKNIFIVSFLSPLSTLIHLFNHKKVLSELLEEKKFDIVVSMFDAEARFLYRIKDGSRKILEIHFSKWGKQRQNKSEGGYWVDLLKESYDNRVVYKYDKFVVLTQDNKKEWGNIPNIEVINNPCKFKVDGYAELKARRVVAVGKLTYQKGYDVLIDVWKIVAGSYKEWTLAIVGDGEDRDMLEEKIKHNDLEESIEILPSTLQIADEYLKSSIYVMTSRYEGMPMVLIEAMVCGLPVVSFSCKSGPSEIVKDGEDGFLIPEGDNYLFAEKLEHLMEDIDLRRRMGERGRRNVVRFSEEKIMKQWCDLFKDVLSKG